MKLSSSLVAVALAASKVTSLSIQELSSVLAQDVRQESEKVLRQRGIMSAATDAVTSDLLSNSNKVTEGVGKKFDESITALKTGAPIESSPTSISTSSKPRRPKTKRIHIGTERNASPARIEWIPDPLAKVAYWPEEPKFVMSSGKREAGRLPAYKPPIVRGVAPSKFTVPRGRPLARSPADQEDRKDLQLFTEYIEDQAIRRKQYERKTMTGTPATHLTEPLLPNRPEHIRKDTDEYEWIGGTERTRREKAWSEKNANLAGDYYNIPPRDRTGQDTKAAQERFRRYEEHNKPLPST